MRASVSAKVSFTPLPQWNNGQPHKRMKSFTSSRTLHPPPPRSGRLPRPNRRQIFLALVLVAIIYLLRLPTFDLLPQIPAPYLPRFVSSPVEAGPVVVSQPPHWIHEGADGSVVVGERDWEQDGHPIRKLMDDARLKWDTQLARQSKTLEQAVETYKTRYGRAPPKGFDAWWKFARANDVLIVDDYDQIHTSITPFLALDPVFLGTRLSQLLTKEGFSYELQVRRNLAVNVTGERLKSNRALEMAKLLDGFRQFLPDDFGEGSGSLGEPGGDDGLVKLSVSDHDLGSRIMGEEFRNRMMGLAERGAHIDQEQLKVMEDTSRKGAMADGLLKACSWRSLSDRKPFKEAAIFTERDDFSEIAVVAPISFVKDPLKSFDFCHNPSIVPYHASYARNQVRTPKLHPQFVLSKIAQSPQILMAPMVAFQNKTSGVTSWEEKTNNKVFWRGSTTGGHYEKKNDFNWRNSHRVRLNALANAHGDSHTDVLVETGYDESDRKVSMKRLHARELNEHLFDVGITAIAQCQESDGTCDEMRDEIKLGGYVTPSETLLYRYALDIDGNGWSSRFRRLVALGQVVFKITIYPEWNTEWLTPWLHYVPVGLDLSDLYHTSTFFIGAPGVSEGNPDLGKVISEAGLDFVEKHWRWQDMQAYMFRLILEYRRAMAHDRDAMSMGGSLML
ncbi:hypothetical protein BDY24DRAFT_444581 [Mrakia frigida]|uniref:uncharacterized protein n=1 Tax=Mrakia frigida TaxID=29902 RepID=UPI003FCBFAD3